MADFSLCGCGTLGMLLSLSLLVSSVVTPGIITVPTSRAGCELCEVPRTVGNTDQAFDKY